MRYGLLSDTHGAVHPALFDLFAGVEALFHAGDVVGADVLAELETIAPIHAVSGNCDPVTPETPPLRKVELPFGTLVLLHGHRHDVKSISPSDLVARLAPLGPRVVVHGHTHVALAEECDGVLVVNPGPAGVSKPGQKSSVAVLSWNSAEDTLDVEFHPLDWSKHEPKR